LTDSSSGQCVVTATKAADSTYGASSASKTFTFTDAPDNPTVANPDVATLTSVTGAASAQINDTANGDNWFIDAYYNNNDHWYEYYFNEGATVTENWHVVGANGKPLKNAAVTLYSNLNYSTACGVTWAAPNTGANACSGGGGSGQGALSGTTDASGNVSFTLVNTNTNTGAAPTDTTTTGGAESNEAKFLYTDTILEVGTDNYTSSPATVNLQTDRVDLILIPGTPPVTPPAGDNPTYAHPDVATMTSVTGGINSTPIDGTADGDNWFINAFYSPTDHWNFTYLTAGSQITETWHVVGSDGNPLKNQTVTLETEFAPGATAATWSATGISNGNVTGTTDASGNVTFVLTNTNSAATYTPGDTTTEAAALAAEGAAAWSRMALVVGTATGASSSTDTITANPASPTVNQATDLVDFIVVTTTPVTPPAGDNPTYAHPDVATMTSVTGGINSTPIDGTADGDNWFIWAFYSPTDHWNFTYLTAGSQITETWHVVGSDGNPLKNQTVTLETEFAPGATAATWSATGISNGNVTGTTDASGNVTFVLTNTNSAATYTPGDTTTEAAALAAEGAAAWSRMALVVGTATGASSSTDTITANPASPTVNQATDLVDLIVVL
jgi:hypothetical protein